MKQRETLEYLATPLNSSHHPTASISPKAILRRKVQHRRSKLTHCHCSLLYPQLAKGISSTPAAVKELRETSFCEHHPALSSADDGVVFVYTATSHHLHSHRCDWIRKAAHGHGEGTAQSNPDSPTALLLGLFCSTV